MQGKTYIVCSKVPPSKIYTTQNWTWVVNQLTVFYAMNSLLYKTFLKKKKFMQKPDKRSSSTFIYNIVNMFEWRWNQISTTADHET